MNDDDKMMMLEMGNDGNEFLIDFDLGDQNHGKVKKACLI